MAVAAASSCKRSTGFLLGMSALMLGANVVWVAYNMLTTNLPFALLSLAVAPIMFLATLYFSNQARRAFRVARQEIGSVNAELQAPRPGARPAVLNALAHG